MGKRKGEGGGPRCGASGRLEVVVRDLAQHPRCAHGPALLFSSPRGQYFACAAARRQGSGGCAMRLDRARWEALGGPQRYADLAQTPPALQKDSAWDHHQAIRAAPATARAYCVSCDELYLASPHDERHSGHHVVTPLSNVQLSHPSDWLPALENDALEAQYLFTKQSVQTILNTVRNNDINNILCIGTPSIHEAVQQQLGSAASLLLDLDCRHHRFWPPDKFLWYNMFNHHFFNGPDDENIFAEFLKSSSESGLCIVMDPPFGGRVEPLAHTLTTISKLYNELGKKSSEALVPIVWVFPYFSEPYITNLLPGLLMHDYQVEYRNHVKFKKASKPDKPGCPVRLFTNLPLGSIDLSGSARYKLCAECDEWVAATNRHCATCGTCTGKNGTTYVHCDACERCVKPTFFHCTACGRCCQRAEHVCGVVLPVQKCYNCKKDGHKRIDCPRLKTSNEMQNAIKGKKRKKHS